ncbi:hypothetical protein LSH36_534g01068 [Paralvinella palmiformis]|uniref:PHD-type domain-containing protein n=1 Tax=Paralvinella palmiformis TaxID=53620 RepID=A0AAD9J7D4_9ANNE|nr:hypothetical protein LSH36_534g01068 [Paralvinella palmiformis]
MSTNTVRGQNSTRMNKKARNLRNHWTLVKYGGNRHEARKRSTYMCPDCGIPVTVEEHRIQCEVCTEWFQDKCQGVSNSLYETRVDETNQISWYCNHCRRGAKVMMGNIMRINERQNKMETRLNEIEKKVKKITEEPRSEPKLTKEIEDMIEEKVNEGISSYREREARKTNVIIHNMPESKKETPTERKADDEEYVLGIAKQIHADNIQIKNIIRLGKKTDDPRPTKARNENRELRQEMDRRSKESETNLVIRRGKIIMMEEKKRTYYPKGINRGDTQSTSRKMPFRKAGEGGRHKGQMKTYREDSSGSSLITEESIMINEDEQIETSESINEDNALPETSIMTRSSHKDTNDERRNLTCLYTNSDSLLGKRDLLKLRIEETKPDTLPKNITRSSFNTEKEYALEGYSAYQGKYQKRGFIMYLAKQLQASRVDELIDHPHEEQIWCSVKTEGSKTILIGNIYHSPGSSSENMNT